jgi:hypothetical protein
MIARAGFCLQRRVRRGEEPERLTIQLARQLAPASGGPKRAVGAHRRAGRARNRAAGRPIERVELPSCSFLRPGFWPNGGGGGRTHGPRNDRRFSRPTEPIKALARGWPAMLLANMKWRKPRSSYCRRLRASAARLGGSSLERYLVVWRVESVRWRQRTFWQRQACHDEQVENVIPIHEHDL